MKTFVFAPPMPCLPSARGILYQDNLDVRQRTV